MTLYKDTFPPKSAYNMEDRTKHESPCMDPHWIAQPIRQGKAREEIDFDVKPEELE